MFVENIAVDLMIIWCLGVATDAMEKHQTPSY